MEPVRAPLDPFGLTPDTAAYVGRPATERALEELLAALGGGSDPVALIGPTGCGKTLLLHLLAERAAPALRGIYLPNPGLAPEEVCTWVVRRIGGPADEDPVLFLRAAAAHLRSQDQAWLLLIDDADALPEATAAWLGGFVREAAGGLRVALAAPEGAGARRVLAAIGATRVVRLDERMSLDETREYVAWRLAHAVAPPTTRAQLGADVVASLHDLAAGNPRRLHLAVAALLRGGRPEIIEDELDARAARARLAAASRPAPAPPAPRADPAPSPPGSLEAAPGTAPIRAASPAPRHVRGAFLVALGAAVMALIALAHLRGG